jgi:hypothetical protein
MMRVRQQRNINFQIRTLPTAQHCIKPAHGLWLPSLTQELLMATKRSGRTKRRPWTKQDVRELKEHSRNKSPVKKIAGVMKRTMGALRQKALTLGLPLGHRR